MKKSITGNIGFTLAEVLLVFSILGIVAVMTMPELVDNIMESSFSKSSDVFLSKLQEVGNQMSIADDFTGYSTNEQFADVFTRYIKVAKRCNSANLSQCFVSQFRTESNQIINTSSLTTSANLTTFSNTNPLVGFTLLNGTSVIMAYDPNCVLDEVDKYNTAISKTYCMSILYDVNASTGPNKIGKDILTINATVSP